MGTVNKVIQRLLPNGSHPSAGGGHDFCPNWPPDVFAVAATLIERSGCYSDPDFTAGWAKCYRVTDGYLKDVLGVARRWAEDPSVVPQRVERLWRKLVKHKGENLRGSLASHPKRSSVNPAAGAWRDAAIRLLAIADEASAGVGFVGEEAISQYVYYQHIEKFFGDARQLKLPYLPYSLCLAVPPDEACVQPKANTPQVGCALRSLSHHVALLPPMGVVATDWIYGHPDIETAPKKPLNLLLVPFPYHIRGNCFQNEGCPSVLSKMSEFYDAPPKDSYFSIKMNWLEHKGRRVRPLAIAQFLSDLVRRAKQETDEIHGIVLPETALTPGYADIVAKKLASDHPDLELFVTGFFDDRLSSDNLPINGVLTYTFNLDGRFVLRRPQSKHHRWRLEGSQISRYHLGHALDPHLNWWEKINVQNRTCQFTNVRPGASFAILICEDLARSDPVLPVLNAIGPNLVIALLMDGPQLKFRWPARYAMALADDPGSSVLTLTCLGMVERSSMPGEVGKREIALWKHADGDIQELQLPKGDHGLLLTLAMAEKEQWTLDMRSDGGATKQFKLAGVRGVRVVPEPAWVVNG